MEIMDRAEALINKNRLIENIETLIKHRKPKKILAMLKGNAYGHGLVEVAEIIRSYVYGFGLASLSEAEKLRQSGNDDPIILMSGFVNQTQIAKMKALEITPVIHSEYQLNWLLEEKIPYKIDAWLKVNSGMNRLGFNLKKAQEIYQMVKKNPDYFNEIIWMTHLAEGEFPDSEITQRQKKNFQMLYQAYPANHVSIENSAALLKDNSLPFDLIRPGAALYGISSFEALAEITKKWFKYVLTFQTQVIALHDLKIGETVGYNGIWQAKKPSKIAIIPVGYADGYPIRAPEGTPVYLNGKLAPIVGKVSMDMISIDVTDVDDVSIGNRVVLWGDELPVEKVATKIGVSPYSLVTGITDRVKRKII